MVLDIREIVFFDLFGYQGRMGLQRHFLVSFDLSLCTLSLYASVTKFQQDNGANDCEAYQMK